MNHHYLLTTLFLFIMSFSYASDITITGPTASDVITEKSITPITWTADSRIQFVKIEYAHQSFTTSFGIIEAVTPNDGSYDWDLHNYSNINGSVVIKITSTTDPGNFGVSESIPVQECTMNVHFEMPTSLCLEQENSIINNSTNADSFEWILNGKTISTERDLNLHLNDFSTFNLALKASNANCYDIFWMNVVDPSLSGIGDSPCINPVIEEMMIADNNENLSSRASVPIIITDSIRILAFQITHDLGDRFQFDKWDWTGKVIPGFSKHNIDLSKQDQGIITVNWTSTDPQGTLYTEGNLYSIIVVGKGVEAHEFVDSSMIEPPKPDVAGTINIKYRNVVATSTQGLMIDLKTKGVLLTKDEVIILEQ